MGRFLCLDLELCPFGMWSVGSSHKCLCMFSFPYSSEFDFGPVSLKIKVLKIAPIRPWIPGSSWAKFWPLVGLPGKGSGHLWSCWSFFQRSAWNRGVQPVAHRPHAAQDARECSLTQNRKFTSNLFFFFAHQFSLVFVYLACGPRQLFFFWCGPRMPKCRTPLALKGCMATVQYG